MVLSACAVGGGGAALDERGFPESPLAADDAGDLNILTWEGYQDEIFHPSFAEEFGDNELNYQYISDNGEAFSKVQTGGAQVDVISPCSNWAQNYVDADLLAPIDVERLSNWDKIDPALAELGKIDGEYYFVPWDWGYESLIVNVDTIPGDIPTSWDDMWDPAYEQQITMQNFGEGAVHLTSLALGLPYPELDDAQLDQVKERLLELKPNIRTVWNSGSDLTQSMTGGSVSIGYGWNDQYAKIKDSGTNVTYIDPEEGRTGFACGYSIMKNTQHYDLAMEYLDSKISTEACTNLTNEFFLGCSNSESVEMADQQIVEDLQLDRQEVLDRTHFAVYLTPDQRTAFNQLWSEVVASYGG